MRWVVLGMAACALSCAPRVSELPARVWESVRVPAGTRTVTATERTRTPPRLPTETGRIAVRLTREAEGVPLAPDAFAQALERWLQDHGAEVQQQMGDRCAERSPCIDVIRWPSLDVGEAAVPEVPAAAAPAVAAPAPGAESAESGIDWVLTAEIVSYDAYTGTLSLDVRARAPGAPEPALSGPIEAPDLATIAARIARTFLPGVENVEVTREEPVFRTERRVVAIRRHPVR